MVRFPAFPCVMFLGLMGSVAGFELAWDPPRVAQGQVLRITVTGPEDLGRPTGSFAGKSLRFFQGASLGAWWALAGADLDLGAGAGALLVMAGGESRNHKVPVVPGKYEVERLTLPPEKVSPTAPEVLARIQRDQQRAKEAGLTDRDHPFGGVLDVPAEGRLSSSFGRRRILNGIPKSPHGGTDIAAPTGTPVRAAAPGVVRLVDDMFYSGWTVFLDHGSGWMTTYMHLSEVSVREGETVGRGARIGAVGATGRVTGAHLHWGLQWLRARIDPMALAASPATATGGGTR